MSSQRVKLHIQERHVVMENGIVQVTISKPEGIVTGIRYNGISNLLELRNDESNRGYWDLVWSKEGSTGTTGIFYVIKGTDFRVILENEEQVEISFKRMWDPSVDEGQLAPLNIDKRFIMLRNSSGFYSYAIYEHLKEWPAFNLPQTRIVFKLRKDKFHYMSVADNKQRCMPLPEDRLPPRGKPLIVPEAVLLVNPVESKFKGEATLETDSSTAYELIISPSQDANVHSSLIEEIRSLLARSWDVKIRHNFRESNFVADHLAKIASQFPVGVHRFQAPPASACYWLNHDLYGVSYFRQTRVDDKYQYSCENKDLNVHGWICFNPPVGFWQITPSNEFRSGGPLKQNLTSHVGPVNLAMFLSAHYSGEDMVLKLKPGEPWKKVFGPVFIYLNTLLDETDRHLLWEDAKQQMLIEVQSWPYSFPASEDFPPSDQRGSVSGRLFVRDSDYDIPANDAYVGLAPPGDAGSWQTENKGYQFWVKADADGCFSINDIRTGDYNLYAYVPGFIGDYRYDTAITITEGCDIDLGDIVYEPPRNGPTLWEIGIPDRSAAEFYIPDPDPKYINTLFVNHPERFRQYGLWERYSDLYPDEDLVYTVGESDFSQDWFFAHVPRKIDDDEYQATTWQIKFPLDSTIENETYTLRLALATANNAELQVYVNNPGTNNSPLFTTGLIGHDNTIVRHGIHGLYRLYSVEVPGSQLVIGDNTIFLTQTMAASPVQGIMYDYIRLEGPASYEFNY